mmetsp:Transcript_34215/g.66637  ORF Transcript_34215/g.66637 Transcript_34215/m.66637 type:complete len:428 (-) Transcript_34215:387-1670(-)
MMESVSGLVGMLPDEETTQCEEFGVIFEGKKPFELLEGDTKRKLEPGASFVVKDKTRWLPLDGTTFMVRSGPDYEHNKIKKASKKAFYECVGVDTLGSPQKISNLGRFMNLHLAKKPTQFGKATDTKSSKNMSNGGASKNRNKSKKSRQRKNKSNKQKPTDNDNSSDKQTEAKRGAEEKEEENVDDVIVPEHFIFQLQLPDYQPSMLSSQGDGEGYCLAFHYRLTDEGREQVQGNKNPAARLLKRFLKTLREKGGPQTSDHPLHLRPKVIMRLVNHEELGLGFVHRKICENFNAKPFLSRPEHTMHLPKDNSYFEIDVDVHLFKYFQRRCAHSFRENFAKAVIDIGIVIEGQGDREMPEQMLGGCRVERLIHRTFQLVKPMKRGTREPVPSPTTPGSAAPAAPGTAPPPPPPGAAAAGEEEAGWGFW